MDDILKLALVTIVCGILSFDAGFRGHVIFQYLLAFCCIVGAIVCVWKSGIVKKKS